MVNTLMIIAWTIINLLMICFAVRFFSHSIEAIKCGVFTVVGFLMGYVLSSAILFTFDCFSILWALILQSVLCFFVMLARFIYLHKQQKMVLAKIDWDIKKYIIPLGLAIVALILSWGNNGYFGMGQDQGVYQVKAIDLMNGKNQKIYQFEEYDKLNTEEEKKDYKYLTFSRLVGLDSIRMTLEENNVMRNLTMKEPIEQMDEPDAIYHGIPTYPALLALFGTIFGMAHMMGMQTLIFILTVFMLWFTAENLGLKKTTSILVCSIHLFSPEALWISKSSLTEGFTALIIASFLYLLTNTERPFRRWWSAWMVMIFSVFHVSIYVMIPMFLALYIILYFWEGDKQYLKAASISSISFMLGFTFMVIVAPRYSIRNTQHIWVGFINLQNVYFILMVIGLIGLILSIACRFIKVKSGFRSFIQGKYFSWVLRAAIIVLLGYSLGTSILKGVQAGHFTQAISTNGIYNMIWMTGIISVPFLIVYVLIKPRNVVNNDIEIGLVFLFGYAVMLLCCVLIKEVAYCYYYGRYYTSYIPIVCILAGIVWDRFNSKVVCAGLVAGTLLMLPFDSLMLFNFDDTKSSFEAVTRIADAVREENAAVIVEPANLFMLPIKAMTSDDCYFIEDDYHAQLKSLSMEYDHVYLVTSKNTDLSLITKVNEVTTMDDNVSNRIPGCPFPLRFLKYKSSISVYEYNAVQTFSSKTLFATGRKGGVITEDTIELAPGQQQYGPYISLTPGTYEVRYIGENLDQAYISARTTDSEIEILAPVWEENRIQYQIHLEKQLDRIELKVFNKSDENLIIKSLKVIKQD